MRLLSTLSLKLSLVATAVLLLTTSVFAAEANLYDQPKAGAKLVGKVDLAAGIIPIFTPTGSDWIKVADPRNGNVGWIKSSDIKTGNSMTFTSRIINKEGKVPQSYQVIQFGMPQKMSQTQVDDMMKRFQAQQRAIQNTTNQTVQHMVEEMNAMSQHQWQWFEPWFNFPVIMPVVIVPAPIAKDDKKPQP